MGAVGRVTLTRETTVRRPDRLYSKVSGDRHNEVWYNGVGITLVMHGEKVFGQARAPETLDKTLDALNERYGVSMPFADYLYSSPAKALLAETTTGGWVGREEVAGQSTDHLSFKDTGVNWEVWISASGDPLPQRAVAEFSDNKRLAEDRHDVQRLEPVSRIGDDRFSPTVPARLRRRRDRAARAGPEEYGEVSGGTFSCAQGSRQRSWCSLATAWMAPLDAQVRSSSPRDRRKG